MLQMTVANNHISLETLANSIATDETPQNVLSHLGLYCLLAGFSLKNGIKMKNHSCYPLMVKWTHPNDMDGKVQLSHMG